MGGNFHRDGFAIIPDVLGDDQISVISGALSAIRPEPASMQRGGEVYAMRNLLRRVPETRRLAMSTGVIALARSVLGPRAFVVRGLLFKKSTDANWLVPWHQDLTIAVQARTAAPGYGPWTVKEGVPHVQPPIDVLERMVTLRIHLDDSDSARGPLRVIPGSHRSGRLGAEAARQWLNRVGPVECLVPRGGILIMRPLILHASSPADAPGPRRVIHLEYAADPLPGGVEWLESEASTLHEIHEDARPWQ